MCITLSDSGEAGEPREESALFPGFFRVTHAAGEEVHSSGLELHLAQALIEQAGGSMWFSEKSGKENSRGISFSLILPSSGMQERRGMASAV